MFFFGFLTKSSKNLEKPKKTKIADPNSPACTYMGLAILFFFGFLDVFFWVFDKSSTSRKQKKEPKKNADPNSPACTYMGLAILFFFGFLVFSMFFVF